MSRTGTPSELHVRALKDSELPEVGRHLLSHDSRDRNARFGGAAVDELIGLYVDYILREGRYARGILV